MLRNTLLRVVIISLFAIGCAKTATRQPAAPPVGTPSVSVMSYNLNFEIAGDQDTIGVVEKHDPDVVFFQEANEVWTRSLTDRLGYRYKHVTFEVDDPYAAGIGMMSKYPIVSAEYLPKADWFPALRVVLDTPLGHLQVLKVHLRPPVSKPGGFVVGAFQTPGIRRHEISEFATYLDPTLPTLIVGDFNENEHGDAVSWLTEHGYHSSLPEFSPNAKTWRWPLTSYVSYRQRFDHLCYNDRLEPMTVAVDNSGWSDHLPVTGVFTLAR